MIWSKVKVLKTYVSWVSIQMFLFNQCFPSIYIWFFVIYRSQCSSVKKIPAFLRFFCNSRFFSSSFVWLFNCTPYFGPSCCKYFSTLICLLGYLCKKLGKLNKCFNTFKNTGRKIGRYVNPQKYLVLYFEGICLP